MQSWQQAGKGKSDEACTSKNATNCDMQAPGVLGSRVVHVAADLTK